jgi:general secretion pathway protein F
MKYKILYQKDDKIKCKTVKTDNLDKEILPENIIEIKKIGFDLNYDIEIFNTVKDKDLKNIFYELSLMLESKILLNDALDILIKTQKKKILKDFLLTLQNSFSKSIDIYKSLERFKINPLVKSFFKITQDSGNISLNIKSLSFIISEDYEVKREFIKSMTYPFVLLITLFSSFLGIFKFVVPKFEFMFKQNPQELPIATKVLLFVKDIFDNYLFFISLSFFIILLISIYLYKNQQRIRYFLDKVLATKIPVISTIYRLKVFYTYFIVIEILLLSKYEFSECLSKAKVLINNNYLLDRITQIENLLKNGKSIYFAFKQVELFDDISLSLIRTGELTNSLDVTIKEIKKIYKKRFDDKLKLFIQLIEPIFFLIIMSLIVWIILAIFVPIWNIGDMLKV